MRMRPSQELTEDVLSLFAESNRREGTPLGLALATRCEPAISSNRNRAVLFERMYQIIVDHGLLDELGDQPPDN